MKREIAVVLFFMRTFSSVGFAIMYSSLALFLIKNLHLSESFAIAMMGIFIALHYSLSLINGFVMGRWVSYINALMIGIVLQISGLILTYYADSFIFLGCAIFLTGSLPSSTAINMIITERFEAHEQGRERMFLWNYAGQNLGNILGFSIAGYFELINNFKNIAYVAVALMLIPLLLGCFYQNKIKDIHSEYAGLSASRKGVNTLKFFLLLSIISLINKELLIYSAMTSNLLLILLGAAFIFLLGYNFKKSESTQKALVFSVLALAYLVFWSLYFLIPTGLTLFANYNTTGKIFDVSIPPAWLPNINSILIILGAPLLGLLFKQLDLKRHWTAIHKFALGLLFMSLAFLLLAGGIVVANFGLVNLIWVAATYVLLTFSELFIAPVGFASVGQYVDRKLQGVMTAMCMSILGLGGLIASKLSNTIIIMGSNVNETNHAFYRLFSILLLLTLIFSIMLYAFKVVCFKKFNKKLF